MLAKDDALLSTLVLLAALAGSQPIYGAAVAGDGDSLSIGGERIRLFGIDAPELHQTCSRETVKWACGSAAAEHLTKLITGHQVRCVSLGRDKHGRSLARCSVGDVDLNRAMVATGYALA